MVIHVLNAERTVADFVGLAGVCVCVCGWGMQQVELHYFLRSSVGYQQQTACLIYHTSLESRGVWGLGLTPAIEAPAPILANPKP